MWELDYKAEQQRTDAFEVVLGKILESPLGSKELKLGYPKGSQSWIFNGRTDVEAETPIRWPPDAKNWLIGKDPDAGKDWRQEKGTTEDEMVGWHHWLHGLGKLWELAMDWEAWCAAVHGGHKELDRTERLNGAELKNAGASAAEVGVGH